MPVPPSPNLRGRIHESFGACGPWFPGPLPRCTWIPASFWVLRRHFFFGFLMRSESQGFRRKGEEREEDREEERKEKRTDERRTGYPRREKLLFDSLVDESGGARARGKNAARETREGARRHPFARSRARNPEIPRTPLRAGHLGIAERFAASTNRAGRSWEPGHAARVTTRRGAPVAWRNACSPPPSSGAGRASAKG